MIRKALMELAKRIFWWIAVTLVLTVPLIAFTGSYLDKNPTLSGDTMTASGWYAMAGLVGFTLVEVGIIVFYIFPTLLELGEAIWEARKNSKDEMFP
jgi:hypothetical protein